MIVQKDCLSMEYYKKAVYTGSDGNLRFRIEKVSVPEALYDEKTGIVVSPPDEESEEESTEEVPMVTLLMATIWKGPYAFANTKEPKLSHWAEFSDEGMTKLIAWMEEEHKRF